MTLNIKTLTKKQKKQLDIGYKIYLNERNKLIIEYPNKPYSIEFIEYSIKNIKLKCQTDILAKYSFTDQSNMNARITEINILVQMEKRDFTDLELEDITLGQSMINYIREQRILCADEIAQLSA